MKRNIKITVGLIAPDLKEIISIARKLSPKSFLIKIIPESGINRYRDLKTIDSLIYFPGSFDKKDQNASKKLKFVQLLTAGIDGFDVGNLKKRGIPIADNNGTNSTAVAEHTIMLILAVMKRLPDLHKNVLSGKWRDAPPRISELFQLEGKTVGIIGLGRIGIKVAKRLLGFGVKVIFYDIDKMIKTEPGIVRVKSLRFLMSQSDILSFHTPLTNKTYHMLNRKTIGWCKDNVIVINTSRGSVLDEQILIKAIKEKHILGLGADVFEHEPYGGRLLNLPSVVLTPHRAGTNIDSWNERIDFAYKNIYRYFNGQKPESLV